MSADLSEPIRTALVGAALAASLPAYGGSKTVFTRRPAPLDAPYPMILVSQDVSVTDDDGVSDRRPVQVRDVVVYGQNDVATHYRAVETLAYAVRALFHRNRKAISVSGWQVVAITAFGPIAGPTDDDKIVARVITLTIQLANSN